VRQEAFYTASKLQLLVQALAGDGFLLAGDAAEFMDPIFSTGVILAMRSGQLAGQELAKTLKAGRAPRASEFRPL